jgi:hypothetical protein
MKNFLVASTLLLFSVVMFSSCKKAYKCQCSDQIVNVYTHKMGKAEAADEKAKCEANEGCEFKRDK